MKSPTPIPPPGSQPSSGRLKSGKVYWKSAMARFRKNKAAVVAYRVILFLVLIAIFADFLAYNKPFYAVYKGETYYPLFNDYAEELGLYKWDAELIYAEWKEIDRRGELESAFWPPIRYSPGDLDYDNQDLLGPFDEQTVFHWKYRHFLGTDREGRDLVSGLIHGTRISLTIGLVAMGIAAILGMFFGSIAGYFGDRRLQLSRIGIVFLVLGLLLGYFYGFQVRSYAIAQSLNSGGPAFIFQIFLSLFIFLGTTVLVTMLARPFRFIPWLGERKYLWMDIALSRFIEIWTSIPLLLLIITISAMTETQSIYLVMVLIGIFGWPGVARYMRGEMLRVRSQNYVEAARALGVKERYILFRHALPNSLAPVLVVIAFGVASVIVMEAGLSFLGIGVPDDIITWGKLLNESRHDISAWWLIVFPGATIFIVISSLNLLGEGLRDALDPKLLD